MTAGAMPQSTKPRPAWHTELGTNMTTKNQSSGLPRRFLRPLLLLSLLRVGRSHGYELAESVRGFGLTVDMAGVYRELRAMEQRDLLESDWEPSQDGPERRVYELTATGAIAAEAAIVDLTMARDLLDAALANTSELVEKS